MAVLISRKFLSGSGKLIFISLILAFQTSSAVTPVGIQAEFVKNNTVQNSGEVASNVLRIVNYTSMPSDFLLLYSVPANWEILGLAERKIHLEAGDSTFVPVRVIPGGDTKGNTSYIISAVLESGEGVRFASQNWYVGMQGESRWKAFLPSRSMYFSNQSDTSTLRVQLTNLGNADEFIRITLLPQRLLSIVDPGTGQPVLLSFVVPLPVGADTVLLFGVKKIRDKNAYEGKKDEVLRSPTGPENYPVQVLAKSTGVSDLTSWTGTVQYRKLTSRLQRNRFNRSALPLVLEANVYDVLSDGTTMSLDAYGSAHIGEDEFLNYRLQTVFVNNFLNGNTFLGSNHYLGYFSDKMTAEAGEINGWGRSLLTGKGVKGSYTMGKNTLGAMYVRSPGLFKNHNHTGYGFYHSFHNPVLTWNNYYSHQTNSVFGITTSLYNSTAGIRISPFHHISVGGGYSNESYLSSGAGFTNPVRGMGWDVNYAGSIRRFTLGAGSLYGSDSYSLFRGVRMQTASAGYRINSTHSLSANGQQFSQHPTYYLNGQLQSGNYLINNRDELRWGIQTLPAVLYIKPVYFQEENNAIRVNTAGSGFEYTARTNGSMRFSSNLFMGYASVRDGGLPSFFLSRFTSYYRWDRLYLSVRYFYGPNQLSEQLRFVHDRINPQTVNLSGSYDYWFGDGKFLLTTLSDVRYESYFRKTTFRLRPELFFYSKSGFRFSAYASYMSSAQQANPLLDELQGRDYFQPYSMDEMNVGFGIRKEIGIPVPGKKYCTLKLVVFKDLNGNGKQDNNEEGLENMLVTIRMKPAPGTAVDSGRVSINAGEDFITDSKGEILFENIPPGFYQVKAASLTSGTEWFDNGNMEVMVDKRQTSYLALGRGTRLSGTLNLLRDKYSGNSGMELGRIRVTAIDSSGKSYSTLTNGEGEFNLFLPPGFYSVSVNEAGLGSGFIIIQNHLTVNLSNATDNYRITFNIVEKKRKLEIKKFNSNGEEIK
ncbi:MAG: hypothetical protein IT242_07545 [Bacteroidia bacterium]|nr:hypothetical protein [Bacteroidia bacterium]